jgi:ATP-dependent DNA helicase RecQ
MPSSLEVYHQEIGRAGRDGLPAECILLYDRGDYHRWVELLACHPFEAQGKPERSEGSPPAPIASSLQPAASVDGKLDALADMECFCGVTMRNALPLCRHAHLVEYFGQTYQPPPCHPERSEGSIPFGCGACDVCLSEPPARAARRKPADRSAPFNPTPCGSPDVPLEVVP